MTEQDVRPGGSGDESTPPRIDEKAINEEIVRCTKRAADRYAGFRAEFHGAGYAQSGEVVVDVASVSVNTKFRPRGILFVGYPGRTQELLVFGTQDDPTAKTTYGFTQPEDGPATLYRLTFNHNAQGYTAMQTVAMKPGERIEISQYRTYRERVITEGRIQDITPYSPPDEVFTQAGLTIARIPSSSPVSTMPPPKRLPDLI